MTVTELCRKNLYSRMGVPLTPRREPTAMQAEICRMTSKLHEVVSLAEPRLIMGGIRHGSDWRYFDLMDYMQYKFDKYQETGNYEMLVDIFNLVVIEGELKTHPDFHFDPEDRKE